MLTHADVRGQTVIASIDAGRYLCDFTYYCSLAEAQKRALATRVRPTPVLFLHCCPVDEPYGTKEVTATIEEIVRWKSARLA